MADRALNVLVNSEKSGNPAYTENHAVSRPLADSDHWYQPNGNKSGDVGGRSDVPDVQMVEALQQVTQDEQEHSREWSPTDLAGSNDREDLSPDQSTHTSVNGKRKRQFSNRTKTGCLTCRRRKKKCDERHPKCTLSYFALTANADHKQAITAKRVGFLVKATIRRATHGGYQIINIISTLLLRARTRITTSKAEFTTQAFLLRTRSRQHSVAKEDILGQWPQKNTIARR